MVAYGGARAHLAGGDISDTRVADEICRIEVELGMASAAEGSGMSRISLTRNAASDHTITEGAGIGRIIHHSALSALGALTT